MIIFTTWTVGISVYYGLCPTSLRKSGWFPFYKIQLSKSKPQVLTHSRFLLVIHIKQYLCWMPVCLTIRGTMFCSIDPHRSPIILSFQSGPWLSAATWPYAFWDPLIPIDTGKYCFITAFPATNPDLQQQASTKFLSDTDITLITLVKGVSLGPPEEYSQLSGSSNL